MAALLAAFLIFSGGPTALQTAYENCNGPSTFGLSIDEDGKGMFLDMQGEEDILGADYSDISCILSELDVPDSVLSQMSNTTALMGTQTATWDNISANWTYHPDRGLDIGLSID